MRALVVRYTRFGALLARMRHDGRQNQRGPRTHSAERHPARRKMCLPEDADIADIAKVKGLKRHNIDWINKL